MARAAKTPKFELFNRLANCFGGRQDHAGELKEAIAGHDKVIFELGAGAAEFALERAKKEPGVAFVAVDLKSDRLAKTAQLAESEGLANIYFLQADTREIQDWVNESSADEVWVTFPDPYPKKRSAKHRQTNEDFLVLYDWLLKSEGLLFLKHDNDDFFDYSIEVLKEQGWEIHDLSRNIYEDEGINPNALIQTRYEKRWLAEGRTIKYLSASRT